MSAITTNTAGNAYLTQIYNCKNPDEIKALYDEWASTFDVDLTSEAQNYVAPALVAQAIVSAQGRLDGAVLDAGCGTGLSGVALSQAGAKQIDGIDLSPGMLKQAEKTGVYRSLETGNLARAISKPDAHYDVVACVGTLTHGHVGPDPALSEFARVLKKGGIFAGTVLEDIWTSGGYEATILKLEQDGVMELLSSDLMDYRKGANVKAKVVVFRKC